MVSAEKALSYGLLNDVVAPDSLDEETEKLAEKIASKSNFAVRLGKKMFYKQLKCDDLEDAYSLATERITCNFQHPDAREGIDGFVNKKR